MRTKRVILLLMLALVAALCVPATAFAATGSLAAGSAGTTAKGDSGGRVLMYRLYNPSSGEHLFTTDANEYKVIPRYGWRQEGVACVVPEKSSTPVYRLYNPRIGLHHYTTDANEKNVLTRSYGWRYEGIGWYSSDAKTVAVYRLYHPRSGQHLYTTDQNEVNVLSSRYGWKREGAGWYALAKGYSLGSFVSTLDVAKRTNQIIAVEATGTRATVSMHVKSNGVWRQVLSTSDGWIGRDGLGPAREGIAYTPTGVLWPDMAFGIKPNPGCPMGYTQVNASHYWVGDSKSPYYNKFVSRNSVTNFNVWDSEHLLSIGREYNYCLNMGYNKACTPYGGSAFFLHCSSNKPTAGCVSVPEGTMIQILKTIRPGCAIVIGTPTSIMRY